MPSEKFTVTSMTGRPIMPMTNARITSLIKAVMLLISLCSSVLLAPALAHAEGENTGAKSTSAIPVNNFTSVNKVITVGVKTPSHGTPDSKDLDVVLVMDSSGSMKKTHFIS